MFSRSKSNIAFVSKRSNNQSGSISKILVTIPETSISLFDLTIIDLSVPVVSELFTELEIIKIFNSLDHKLRDHISSVDIQDNKCTHLSSF